ncbi:hypothetical protein FSARC_6858 [Fusarium sarcochroum]|uniref:N-acetyltransferase domain-containing protein n=1 Tax=Fusarium sarcochroum TaxID=1208366 RepID=A0A8H4X7X8_9HYPO|nr:hypothetical protein FSARC_6858 [Fusarium sarcochroum]
MRSQRVVNDNFEESQKAFQKRFLDEAATRPWMLKKAIMVSRFDGGVGREAAGFISAASPSPNGLLLSYHLRYDCWNKGYATAAVRVFLDEYWGLSRMAPRNEIYTHCELADSDQAVEIKYLIGEVDVENKGSMRVMEKCGGKIIGTIEDELLRFQGPRSHAVWQLDKP